MSADYTVSKLSSFCLLDEPPLTFNPDDTSLDVNPLRGLDRYGAYSSLTFPSYTPALRIATLAPAGGWANLRTLVNTLRSNHAPSDRKEYVPAFRGFENVFGVPLVAASTEAHVKWPDDLSSLGPDGPPHDRLLHALRDGMNRLALVRDQFDVVMVHLPDVWQTAFRAPGFDAHDVLKALGAAHGIPTQVINDRALSFSSKASLAWRLSIALYVKTGGIPWKLAPLPGVPDNTAYIGACSSWPSRLVTP
jgi:hypothetical protein